MELRIANLSIIILLGLGAMMLNLQIRRLDSPWVQPEEQVTQKPNPLIFKTLTFGHWPAGLDWSWLRFLQDESIAHVAKGTHPSSYYELNLISDLDPAQFEVYWAAGNYLSVIRDDSTGAMELLERGTNFYRLELPSYPEEFREKFWPGAWSLYVIQAYIYLFDFNDLKRASGSFSEAAGQPGAPEYLLRLKKRLEAPGGQYTVGIRLINFLIGGLPRTLAGQKAKAELEKKRDYLTVSEYVFELNERFRSYLGSFPGYRTALDVSRPQLLKYWSKFLRENSVSAHDPWGGQLSLDADGTVVTNTPHERVFGLD